MARPRNRVTPTKEQQPQQTPESRRDEDHGWIMWIRESWIFRHKLVSTLLGAIGTIVYGWLNGWIQSATTGLVDSAAQQAVVFLEKYHKNDLPANLVVAPMVYVNQEQCYSVLDEWITHSGVRHKERTYEEKERLIYFNNSRVSAACSDDSVGVTSQLIFAFVDDNIFDDVNRMADDVFSYRLRKTIERTGGPWSPIPVIARYFTVSQPVEDINAYMTNPGEYSSKTIEAALGKLGFELQYCRNNICNFQKAGNIIFAATSGTSQDRKLQFTALVHIVVGASYFVGDVDAGSPRILAALQSIPSASAWTFAGDGTVLPRFEPAPREKY